MSTKITVDNIANNSVGITQLNVSDGSNGQFLTTDGSGNLSFSSGTTINNNADNRVITGSGTANTLEGESNFVFDSTNSRVGIGTTSPDSILHLETTTNPTLSFYRNDSGILINNGLGMIQFGGSDSGDTNDAAIIRAQAEAGWGASSCPTRLSFWTTPTGSTSATERLRIDKDGRVGVNQVPTGSNFALQVQGIQTDGTDSRAAYFKGYGTQTSIGSTGPTVVVQNANTTTNNYAKLSFESGNAGETVSINAQNIDHSNHYGDMAFNTRGSNGYSEKMRITSNGNVGIGTTSPSRPLEVSGSGDTLVRITGGSANAKGIEFYKGSGTATQLYNVSDDLRVFTNAAERMRVNNVGALLINTTQEFDSLNGRGNLVVGSGSGNEGITIYSGNDSQGGIIFADGTSGTTAYPGQIQYTHSDNSMRFYTNAGTERMRIRNTGTMYLSDPDSGNYVASFTSQVKANAINVGPYATFGTDYSGWGSCLGWNVRPKIGTTNSGFEAATGYYAAGASMVRMAGNTFGVTTWTASEIAQSNIGAGTTFISLAASGATTLGQNSGNLTDNYALKVQTSHGLGEQGSHNSSYFHHNTDRPYYYFSNACYASGGFHTYSDEKLKKNITTISGALDDVAKMNGVTFNWKDPETRGSGKTGKQFGVIAQNMLEVDSELPLLENDPLSPEETIETDESYYSMDYSRITPFLIEAIKELKEKLETAEARITELEG